MKYQHRVAVATVPARALTLALTHNGAHVAAFDVSPKGLAETQAACRPG